MVCVYLMQTNPNIWFWDHLTWLPDKRVISLHDVHAVRGKHDDSGRAGDGRDGDRQRTLIVLQAGMKIKTSLGCAHCAAFFMSSPTARSDTYREDFFITIFCSRLQGRDHKNYAHFYSQSLMNFTTDSKIENENLVKE